MSTPMDPALWSTLPEELLQLLFARLPLPEVIRLRCLSRGWEQSFKATGTNVGFMLKCTEARPIMFAMFKSERSPWPISFWPYDIRANRWTNNFLHQAKEERRHLVMMCSGDRGLVCLVSTTLINNSKRRNPLVFTVMNPLTGQRRLLSLPKRVTRGKFLPRMLQLVANPGGNKHYKVIVVCGTGPVQRSKEPDSEAVAYIYSSETDMWITANTSDTIPADLLNNNIFGYQYYWYETRTTIDPIPSGVILPEQIGSWTSIGTYDCTRRRCHRFAVENVLRSKVAHVTAYALVQDRLFVLHIEEPVFNAAPGLHRHQRSCISEYQGQRSISTEPDGSSLTWVKLKVHSLCEDLLKHPGPRLSVPHYGLTLFACRGFLMLAEITSSSEGSRPYRYGLTWLYDLSTSKWQTIPAFPNDYGVSFSSDAMCELRWDAVP